MIYIEQLSCPISFPWLYVNIIATKSHILEVMFSNKQEIIKANEITQNCKDQLSKYFSKELIAFDLPLNQQTSVFVQDVYSELIKIPYGETRSYSGLAEKLGSKAKARAVGRACAINKVSIIIPCHRIISSVGHLTGYAGGLDAKKWLLLHESNPLFCQQLLS